MIITDIFTRDFWAHAGAFGSDLIDQGITDVENTNDIEISDPRSVDRIQSYGSWGRPIYLRYDGEKSLGEIGPLTEYIMDFPALRLRSWKAYTDSDLTKTVLDKYILWMIDEGLKLQANPTELILESEGIDIDKEKFNDIVEARWTTWANSKNSSYNGMENINVLSKRGYKNGKIAGDVLVVLRLVDDTVKVQLIDGAHIQSPISHMDEPGKNTIRDGVEFNSKGEHIAFHVMQKDFTTKRILAKGAKTGLTMAFIVYGGRYRLDNKRGVPIMSTSLETISKIDRYKEAAVGSAEERQKIAYTIEHQIFSDGTSPLQEQVVKAFNASSGGGDADLPIDDVGNELANTIAATTNKETYNMPKGAQLKSLESKNEMFFKEFYTTLAHVFCSAIGIPPNVAFSLYDNSFSASRTATKDWEHSMIVERADFTFQFYQNIYNFWLHVEILQNKIQAPGYLEAFSDGNFMVLEAYRRARFVGSLFPHIDPLKEVKAERAKLGPAGEHLNLSTAEASTETLNAGDFKSNIEQFAKELELAKDLGIEPVQAPQEEEETEPANEPSQGE